MSETWLISDTHFAHSNILKYEAAYRPFNTIEEHDRALIDNWNKVVAPNDLVYHLGDVAMGKGHLWKIAHCNGRKRLVLGNHDVDDATEYLKHFEKLYGAKRLHQFMLTHIPVRHDHHKVIVNLHGHIHSNKLDSLTHYNCSVEAHDLAPVNLDKIIQDIKDRK